MKEEHTPEPWALEKATGGRWFIYGDECPDGVDYFAEINNNTQHGEANAHLLLTAPKLLRSLKALLGVDNPPTGESGHIDLKQAVIMGHRAIADVNRRGD